ncbi:SDR family oxidoreductase [Sinosporangium siamense]|nr:SDR family oxidoreductase [Sinosporangium siamense]
MIAFITGANKGIGFEIARQLRDKEVTVVIGARDAERGQAAADELGADFVRIDVTDDDSVAAAAGVLSERYGRLDILVNNAGIAVWGEEGLVPSEAPLGAVRKLYETNVFGGIRVTNALMPLLRKADAARLVFVSSGLGSIGAGLDRGQEFWALNFLGYNSSKAALNMVAVSYAKELWDTPIKVNLADPGYCATDLNEHTGPRTPAQGAAVAVRLALLGADGPTGAYMSDEGEVPW